MSRINLTTGSYQRTFSFDKETLEGIIENNFLPQTPEKLLKLLGTLDDSGALDDAVDVLYDTIENLLINYARIVSVKNEEGNTMRTMQGFGIVDDLSAQGLNPAIQQCNT